MASCDATGPCGMVCTTPSSVVTLVYGLRFWITPCEQSKSAATMESGSSTYSVPRMKSTQKLPRVLVEWRAKPLTTAMATAIPVAAEKKLWVARAIIWVRFFMVVSGVYDCQLVFVVKLAAVFQLRCSPTLPRPSGFSGNHCWSRWIRDRKSVVEGKSVELGGRPI